MSASSHRYLSLFSAFLSLSTCSSHLGPLQAKTRLEEVETPHYDDPSCVWFTLQDQLPAETVQLITYGAPEVSAYLAMGLMGRRAQSSGYRPTSHSTLQTFQEIRKLSLSPVRW